MTDETEVRLLDRSVQYIIDGQELKFFRKEDGRRRDAETAAKLATVNENEGNSLSTWF